MPSPTYAAETHVICETKDVRIAEITIPPHSDTPEHSHPDVPELCYCLAGELSAEEQNHPTVVLRAGQKMRFAAGARHKLVNRAAVPCTFLLIHAGGGFDFVTA